MGLRVGGLSSGIDTAALVEALMTLERRPLDLVQQRKSEIESRRDLFMELNDKLVAFRDAAAALDNLSSGLSGPAITEELLAYTASSSDESILRASASSGAVPGTTEVVVDLLAQTAREVSDGFASATDIISGSRRKAFQISHGGPEVIDIRTDNSGVSLVDLADLINTDVNNGGEVRADVVFDGSDYRLVISGTNPGVANDLSISGNLDIIDSGLSQDSSDAQLTAFGIPITRSSNNVGDLIPGVTLDLLAAAPGTPVQVQVSRDDDAVEEKVQAMVDAYNEIMDFMAAHARYDAENERAGPLVGDATIRSVESQIRRAMVESYEFTDNPFSSLAQIGLSLESDGRLDLDSEVFREALTTDARSVRQLLSGDGVSDGAAVAFSRLIDPIVDPDPETGAQAILAIRNDGFDDQIEALERQIERLEVRLERREELLVLQFTQMETALAQLQNQGNALSSLSILTRDRS